MVEGSGYKGEEGLGEEDAKKSKGVGRFGLQRYATFWGEIRKQRWVAGERTRKEDALCVGSDPLVPGLDLRRDLALLVAVQTASGDLLGKSLNPELKKKRQSWSALDDMSSGGGEGRRTWASRALLMRGTPKSTAFRRAT